jgi:tetratricopeptide (TPR) repeat protein
MYEQLASERPDSVLFAERLASCLLAKFENLPAGEDRAAPVARTKAVAEHAKSLGDDSNFLQVLLDAVASEKPGSVADFDPQLRAAEAAFSRGDMNAALAGYRAVADADPKSYEARLFAGDVYFRMGDARQAGEWFQKAIDVDPDREVAYRYWGDALVKAGDKDAALDKFIDAVVADPYSRKAWTGLGQWAKAVGATLAGPSIQLPDAPAVDDSTSGGHTTISIDPGMMSSSPDTVAAWLVYSTARSVWRKEGFAKAYPDEKVYRHSLGEELEAIGMLLVVIGAPKGAPAKDDAHLRDLVQLNQEGLLPAYVLINRADEGIAKDYAAYRAQHRELLRAYIRNHVVHRR